MAVGICTSSLVFKFLLLPVTLSLSNFGKEEYPLWAAGNESRQEEALFPGRKLSIRDVRGYGRHLDESIMGAETESVVGAEFDIHELPGKVDQLEYLNPNMPLTQGLLLVLCVLLLSSLVSLFYGFIRNTIYLDGHIIDTFFDSGGDVNSGLMSCFVVSRWLWIGTLIGLTASLKMADLAGHMWYSLSGCIPIFISTMLAFRIRIIAPGAKTFLQVIKARFGSCVHILMVILSLLVNVLIGSMLLLETTNITTSLCQDIESHWMSLYLMAVACLSALLSGLGGSIYFSYCVCAFTSSTAVMYFWSLMSHHKHLSDFSNLVVDNDGSRADINSMLPSQPLMVMMQTILRLIGGIGVTVLDQSFWMSAVASKPNTNVKSHLFGGICWFLLTFSLSFTFGVTASSLPVTPESMGQLATHKLNSTFGDDLLPVYASHLLMGRIGDYITFSLAVFLYLACMVPQLLSIASIVVYDIAIAYHKRILHDNPLPLQKFTQQQKDREISESEICENMASLSFNFDEEELRSPKKEGNSFDVTPITKKLENVEKRIALLDLYLERQNYDFRMKNLSIACFSCIICGLTTICFAYGLDSSWILLLTEVISGSSLIPIFLTFFWRKTSACGMFFGVVIGLVVSLALWTMLSIYYSGSLSDVLVTSMMPDIALLVQCTSVLLGALSTIILSCCKRHETCRQVSPKRNRASGALCYMIQTDEGGIHDLEESAWSDTLAIDSPLISWQHLYAKELEVASRNKTTSYAALLDTLNSKYSSTETTSQCVSCGLTSILLFTWPVMILLTGFIPTHELMGYWKILVCLGSCLTSLYLVVYPLISEVVTLWKAAKRYSAWKCRYEHLAKRRLDGKSELRGRGWKYNFSYAKKWNCGDMENHLPEYDHLPLSGNDEDRSNEADPEDNTCNTVHPPPSKNLVDGETIKP